MVCLLFKIALLVIIYLVLNLRHINVVGDGFLYPVNRFIRIVYLISRLSITAEKRSRVYFRHNLLDFNV